MHCGMCTADVLQAGVLRLYCRHVRCSYSHGLFCPAADQQEEPDAVVRAMAGTAVSAVYVLACQLNFMCVTLRAS